HAVEHVVDVAIVIAEQHLPLRPAMYEDHRRMAFARTRVLRQEQLVVNLEAIRRVRDHEFRLHVRSHGKPRTRRRKHDALRAAACGPPAAAAPARPPRPPNPAVNGNTITLSPAHRMLLTVVHMRSFGALCHISRASPVTTSPVQIASVYPPLNVALFKPGLCATTARPAPRVVDVPAVTRA